MLRCKRAQSYQAIQIPFPGLNEARRKAHRGNMNEIESKLTAFSTAPSAGIPVYLVGFAGELPTPEVCLSLRSGRPRIVCFERSGLGANKFARQRFVEYVPVAAPEENLDGTVADLTALIGRLRPQAIVPCDDAALTALSLVSGCEHALIVPRKAAAEFALDKWAQIEAAHASGFAVMRTQLVNEIDDILGFPPRPAILKPRKAMDRRGAGIDKGRAFLIGHHRLSAAAQAAIAERPYLVQEYKAGVGEGLFGIARDGCLYAVFGHRRLRMMNPAGSGASACVSRRPDTAEIAATEALIRRIQWHGPFMVELLRDRRGTPWFMEFNGRFWGSLALTRRCGLEMPRLAVALAAGENPDIPTPIETGFARHLGRDIVHLLFVLRGPDPGPRPYGWPGRLSTIRQIALPNRLRSFYNYDRSQPLFFIVDAARTVASALRRGIW